ncbi:thiol-disulfide isomerase [bacterium]|nr:thiol-disulfide isomerase [bacterium]
MKAKPDRPDETAAFEQALAQTGEEHYVLRLYLTGHTSRSLQAVQAVNKLCEENLAGRYELEIVDLSQQPELAQAAQIIAAPTLVKELPLPLRRLIGDLTDPDRVLVALNLKPIKPKP